MKINNSTMKRVLFLSCVTLSWYLSSGQSPETAMREFASGQIKKGVRSIGMGGDGATWGNYALVYRDTDTALFDAGEVHFSDTGNTFGFTAVGATSPPFWGDAAFYVIGL